MEKPQGRISRVVQPCVFAFGKHVWNEPVANVVAERAKNVPRLQISARSDGQPFKAYHRIAAPIREPVITGYDRANFITGGARAHGVLDATCGRDDELVC